MYPSNYSNYGGGAAYPPQFGGFNSGPPPPPMMNSAYNVNQYGGSYGAGGYGGFGQGYNMAGAVPGFTVPAVQQCNMVQQQMMQQMAAFQLPQAPMGMPVTSQVQRMDNLMFQSQLQLQQQMKEMLQMQLTANQPAAQQEQGEAPSAPGMSEEEMNQQVKERMKQVFITELLRREKVSGTFELTEGTVKPFEKYDTGDPVCTWYKEHGSEDIEGQRWNKEADCMYLRKAMKGLGTNDDAIIHVVSTRCNAQRQELKKYFKTTYGRDLIKDLKGELRGDYKELVMALFVSPAEYDAWCIKEAIYGPGTDEQALIEILLTRTNNQIGELCAAYPNVLNSHYHGREPKIEKDIEDDTSGDFKRLLISAAQGGRSEIPPEQLEAAVEEIINPETKEGTGMFQVNYQKLAKKSKAEKEAKQLFEAGEDRWGTDEETFIRIFALRNYYQMRETWNEYVKLTQRDILNSVDRETSGDFKAGLRAIVMNIRCRPMYFAERLKKAMKGLGTDERTLIRIIVSRSEIDMVQIKNCFLDLTKKTLWKWLEEDTSFNFKTLLQRIVGRN